jgi:streptomycin 6-kinase
MSIIVRCTTGGGRAAVLKLAPDRERLGREAAALAAWTTPHVPSVYAVDAAVGALLLEAIEPGGMLLDAGGDLAMDSVAALIDALHSHGSSSASFPPLAPFITYHFDGTQRHRQNHPELVELVPDDLYERSRRFAARLAAQPSRAVLLHGDLTPVNVLDGGRHRGLVAIDPAPCLGDPAYDMIDLLVFGAPDVATIEARATALATATGVDATRLLDWCIAFAGMFVIDLAGPGKRHVDDWHEPVEPLLRLASQVPR